MNRIEKAHTRKLSAGILFSSLFLLFTCLEAAAQSSTSQRQTTAKPMVVQAKPVGTTQLKRFCEDRPASSRRGSKTTYTCKSNAGSSAGSIQAQPTVERADVNCSYSDSGGVMTWLGCTCKANDDGNCNNFISNCVEAGDDIEGNSGSASCGPSGG